MSNHVHKMIEVVGSSEIGVDDAIKSAIRTAAKTVDNLEWFQVDEIRGAIAEGEASQFQVVLKLGFRLYDM